MRFDYPLPLQAPNTHAVPLVLLGTIGLEQGREDEGAAVAQNIFPS